MEQWIVFVVTSIFLVVIVVRVRENQLAQEAELLQLKRDIDAEVDRRVAIELAKVEESVKKKVSQELIFFQDSLYEPLPN
jgi:membrane protein implicated in regulation of membrane protease activity